MFSLSCGRLGQLNLCPSAVFDKVQRELKYLVVCGETKIAFWKLEVTNREP